MKDLDQAGGITLVAKDDGMEVQGRRHVERPSTSCATKAELGYGVGLQ
jgi:hypothetical protein